MPYFHRKPTRLKNYNYSQSGIYFITLCSQNRVPLFSSISENSATIHLSEYGHIIEKYLHEIPKTYDYLQIDHYVIMPDHIHLLLQISRNSALSDTQNQVKEISPANQRLPNIISTLKRFTNKAAGFNLWQRSYYDHIVRDEHDYLNIWQYIEENPLRWLQKNRI